MCRRLSLLCRYTMSLPYGNEAVAGVPPCRKLTWKIVQVLGVWRPPWRPSHSKFCCEEPFYLGRVPGKHAAAAFVSKEPGAGSRKSSTFQVASEQPWFNLMRKDQDHGGNCFIQVIFLSGDHCINQRKVTQAGVEDAISPRSTLCLIAKIIKLWK